MTLKLVPRIYWLVFFTILIKLIFLPFAQNIDADVTSRIFISQDWANNPHWINSGNWLPLHFYLNGIFLSFINDPIYLPKIINILISSFALIPFFFFTRRLFNENGAFIATIFLAICPVLFHNSFLALSETPYLFFLVLSLNFLLKGIQKNSYLFILFSGLSITIAGGFRYEAWVLAGILGLLLLLLHKWKQALLFLCIAFIFPIIWLTTSVIDTGNALNSFNWAIDAVHTNKAVELESILRRIWFFPFSWMISLGPIVAFLVIKTFVKYFKHRAEYRTLILWSLPFFIMFIIIQFNTFIGSLLLQHRFTGTLTILSLPFIAEYFKEINSKKIKHAIIIGFVTVGLSFAYNTKGVKPIPRLHDQEAVTISQIIKANSDKDSYLILDFVGWENTYYIALQSRQDRQNIYFIQEKTHQESTLNKIKGLIDSHQKGFILLRKHSEIYQAILPGDKNNLNSLNNNIKTQTLYQDNKNILLLWRR